MRAHILIVEDDPQLGAQVEKRLADAGYATIVLRLRRLTSAVQRTAALDYGDPRPPAPDAADVTLLEQAVAAE